MKNFMNLSKRALALFVSVMMCMGILQVDALAAVIVEAKAQCGMEEHTHTSECYPLSCALTEAEATEGHTHTEDCYTAGELVLSCGLDETEAVEGHAHGEDCYDELGTLICILGESEAVEGHTHTEACYTAGEPVLSCGLVEAEATEGHAHSDECYDFTASPICGKMEHTHDASCNYSADNVYKELFDSLKDSKGDKDVVLILNGTTLDMNKYTNGNIRVDMDGKTLTIQDGNVAGGTIQGTGGKRVITVLNGGSLTLTGSTVITNGGSTGGVYVGGENASFTMEGGEISGNKSNGNGGGVLVENGATFNMSGGTISDNESTNGGGVAVKDGTFNMTGGTISENTSKEDGGGVYVDNGTFNMTGGEISGNTATPIDKESYVRDGNPGGQGGGVYVTGENGKFELSGGTISSNHAGEGGGIFINNDNGKKSSFTMTGGTVTENIAELGEGGGIYIFGTGKITAGQITNNKTLTTNDLGGGGIYIETDGDLQILNAIITKNTAEGLGGGIAACVHGKTVVYVKNGAAIYGNGAAGTAHSYGHTKFDANGNGAFIDGYDLWKDNPDFVNQAQDMFTASSSEEQNAQGYPGVIVGTQMLGGGDAGWIVGGFMFQYNENGELVKDDNGNPIYAPVEIDKDGGIVYSNRLLGMTANPSEEAIQEAETAAQIAAGKGVLISGNYSATHGGGIGNNGVLTIGEGPFQGTTETEVDLNKTLTAEDPENSASEDRVLKDEEFTFVVTEAPQDGKEPQSFVGKNDEEGNVSIQFPEGYFTQAGIYTFYVTEQDTGDSSITYDKTVYKVTIEVTGTEEKYTIGNNDSVTVIVLNVTNTTYEKQVIDADGNVSFESVDGIHFVNTYTPETPPPTPSRGGLTIQKVDSETGDALAGATFTITGPNGYNTTATTDGSGVISISDLEPGEYTVTETDAPAGYILDSTSQNVTVAGGETASTTVANTKIQPNKGALTITKAVVGGGAAVAEMEYSFTVTGPNGYTEAVTLKAGESATLSDLDEGTYTITEADASVNGYTWNVSGDVEVEVTAGGSANATVTNTYTELEPDKGALTIQKVDSETGAALAGATFTITGPNGYNTTATTDGSGVISISGLEPGEYTVTETDAPAGYILDSASQNVTVVSGETASVTVANTRIPEEPPVTPEEPPEVPVEPTPDPDPVPPTTPDPEPETPVVPENPEVEVPEEPTPLENLPELPVVSDDTNVEPAEEPVEEPTVDLNEDPVPLSAKEEDPEEEILEELPEDPVPLSDIPATGDISALWYAAAALSAAGLLALLGKKREDEQA